MAVNLAELTNGNTVVKEVDGLNTFTWEGTAVFDVLVRIVNENLKIQYDAGRIKATDYAEAYIAGLQSCIAESMKFIMEKDNLMKDIEVKQANIDVLTGQKDNLLKDLEVKQADINLTTQQKVNLVTDNELKEANIVLTTQQKVNLVTDNALKEANILLTNQQADNLIKDIAVKQANIELTTQQTANLITDNALKEANIDLTNQQAANLTKDLDVKQSNIDLLNRQREGFDDNKHQKLFEAQMNAWALMFSSGLLTDKPTIISNDSASTLYNTLKP